MLIILCILCGSAGLIMGPLLQNVLREFKTDRTKLYKASQDMILPPPLSGNESIPSLRVPREFCE